MTDQEAIDYVRTVWGLTDVTDEVIRETLYTSYNGIPYKAWISFFIVAPQFLEPLSQGDYATAAATATKIAGNFAIEVGLAQVGLGGVAAMASLAATPILLGISAFQSAAADAAFANEMNL